MANAIADAPLDKTPVAAERTRMASRVSALKKSFDSVKPVLRDIGEHMAPYRGQWDEPTSQDQRGKRKGLKVINNVAGRSFSILSSGMMSGLTSPSRPWFKLNTQDPDLAEYTPHRVWLDDCARSMRGLFARSNLYNVLPNVYSELAPFGTAALQEVEDPQSVIRFYPFTIGSYGLAQDDRMLVDTFTRKYATTIRAVVARWGINSPGLSEKTRLRYQQGLLEETILIQHLIEPNFNRKMGAFGFAGMPFVEEYWEVYGDKTEPLARTGLQERALFAPRWDVTGNDLWGTGLGHAILGDVKQLQFTERRSEDVLEKHTAPPIEAGIELRGKRISLLAGDVTYTNPQATGGASVRPIVTTHPNAYQYANQKIEVMERRIRSACFEDLFLMLANDTRSGITAREVEERHQEKMLVLGPVLERLNEELLDPLIDRTFAIMQRRSVPFWRGMVDGGVPLLPPPPKELEGVPLEVEYTSVLAQAAKATNTRGLEAFGMFVTTWSQAKMLADQAGISEKINWDQGFDEYADAQGIPPRLIVGDDDVAAARDEKAKQARMQQMVQMAPALKDAASAMKDAATTVPQDGSVLSNMAGQGSAGLATPLNGP